MTIEEVKEAASNIVEEIIILHKENKLGNKELITYLDDSIEKYDKNDYYLILNYFCKHLSKEGYEIMRDTNHFDIIDYNSSEYIDYINLLERDLPKNYNKLRTKSIKYADDLIDKYDKDKVKLSYIKYLNSVIPDTYDDNESAIIEVGIVSRITKRHYDIRSTDPFELKKF